jgi:putative membrane protein
LYKDASSSTDEDVRRLAATSLPRLEQHLQEAEALVTVIARGSAAAH